MAEERVVRLYIYDGKHNNEGLTLTGSSVIALGAPAPNIQVKTETKDEVKTETKVISSVLSQIELTLVNLEYSKKVFEPCKIIANLQVGVIQERTDITTLVTTTGKDGVTSTNTSTDEGKFKPVKQVGKDKLDILKGAFVNLEIDNNMVAKNYYVHKIHSVYKTVSGMTSLFVELTIFSRDKLMTLDKYSRAYTAKRLYTDILSEEAKKFSSVDVANHMQLLKYKDSETQNDVSYDVTKRDELRIPYIVQYDESFYQFMVRAANRFGEFLYFEDGKLNLGMQPSDTNYYKKDSKGAVVKENDVPVIIDWALEPNAVRSRYYNSVISEDIEVEDRAYNYNDHDNYDDLDPLHVSDSDKRYNIDPVPADEWTKQSLTKSGSVTGYVTQADLWQEEAKTHIVSFVCRCIGATSFSDFIVNLSYEMAKEAYSIWQQCKSFNHIMDEHNYDPITNDDQKSGDHFSQFVTYDGSNNLNDNLTSLGASESIYNFTDLFYPLIRKKEKETGEQAVWLDFGSNYRSIKLGDKLRVDGKDYVAILVEGSYEDGKEQLLVSAVPVFELSSYSGDSSSSTTSTSGDPWTSTIPVPPALPNVIIRDARPQVAFVAEMTDPEMLGRIRVRYPWQHKEDDMSPWIRVTLPLATSGGAVNFTPSVGDEVMVGYEHGNIDRPYAMGYLTAPFMNSLWGDSLPYDEWGAKHGIKIKTGHHLTFDDGFNAAKFTANMVGGPVLSALQTIWPVGWYPWPLGNVHSADLAGGFELSDRYGFYKISGSTDERSVTIESPMGTVSMNAFQGITISAPNGDVNITGKNVTISANNKLNLISGNTVKDRFYYQKTWAGSKKKKFLSGLTTFGLGALDSLKSLAQEEFMDMSFLRCVLEVLLRPVDGTLQIKSFTFVRIEAGAGTAEMPADSLRRGDESKDNKLKEFRKAYVTTNLIKKNVDALMDDIHVKYDALCDATMQFKGLAPIIGKSGHEAKKYKDVVNYAVGGSGATKLEDTNFTWSDSTGNNLKAEEDTFNPQNKPEDKKPVKTDQKYKNKKQQYEADFEAWKTKSKNSEKLQARNAVREKNRKKIIDVSNILRAAAYDLKVAVEKWTGMNEAGFLLDNQETNYVDKAAVIDLIKTAKLIESTGLITLDKMKKGDYGDNIQKVEKAVWKRQKKALMRYIAYKYLEQKADIQKKGSFATLKEVEENKQWKAYTKSIEQEDKSLKEKIKDGAQKVVTHEWFPWSGIYTGIWENATKWKNGFKGGILLSQSENETSYFDESHQLKTYINRDFFSDSIEYLKKLLKKF